MIVNQKQAEAARLLLMKWAADEVAEANDATVACITKEHVSALYRSAAMATHPDKMQSHADFNAAEAFAAVDRAKHVLLAWLERPQPSAADHKKKPCDYCGGLGHVYTAGRAPGSMGLRRTCPKCRGSGDAEIDLHNP